MEPTEVNLDNLRGIALEYHGSDKRNGVFRLDTGYYMAMRTGSEDNDRLSCVKRVSAPLTWSVLFETTEVKVVRVDTGTFKGWQIEDLKDGFIHLRLGTDYSDGESRFAFNVQDRNPEAGGARLTYDAKKEFGKALAPGFGVADVTHKGKSLLKPATSAETLKKALADQEMRELKAANQAETARKREAKKAEERQREAVEAAKADAERRERLEQNPNWGSW